MNAPVIEAHRVPPSAWITSQSIQTVLSPSFSRSTILRSHRPMSLWISCVRPESFPLDASLVVLVFVDEGSIEYSAVTQPCPLSRRKEGTLLSMEAEQSTRVPPIWKRTDPWGWII